MGRRSRKRAAPTAGSAERRAAPLPSPPAARRRGARPERPPAPWGKFPLVELCVLIAIVIGVIGFITWGQRGQVMVAAATALGSLAGLEVSIREHFAGFKSHSTLLGGVVAVVALGVMFFVHVGQQVMLAVGAAVFGTAFYVFRELFKRRSGGLGFR